MFILCFLFPWLQTEGAAERQHGGAGDGGGEDGLAKGLDVEGGRGASDAGHGVQL